MFNNKTILVTGGTGSFGKCIVRMLMDRYDVKKLIIFSRDELKQYEMRQGYNGKGKRLRFFIGDVRDPERLNEAFNGVDYVIHAAALKQVPAIEYNPFEAIQTNVIGAQNIIRAAIRQRVKKVIALSTDKAASPINLYGASKLCSDKLFIAGNSMSGTSATRFAVVRYGNVFGSRGSVVPLFKKQRDKGTLTVTDDRMTRFSITLPQAAEFVLKNFERMHGGEVFVPKIPSYRIMDLAHAIAPDAHVEITGIRPGEKLHEMMISKDDARKTLEYNTYFVIQPDYLFGERNAFNGDGQGVKCAEDFSYTSDNNDMWLSVEQLHELSESDTSGDTPYPAHDVHEKTVGPVPAFSLV